MRCHPRSLKAFRDIFSTRPAWWFACSGVRAWVVADPWPHRYRLVIVYRNGLRVGRIETVFRSPEEARQFAFRWVAGFVHGGEPRGGV